MCVLGEVILQKLLEMTQAGPKNCSKLLKTA